MAIVLRRSNGDIIFFDAVINYGVTYSSSVTKHPVATGGYVSDHTTTDNVILQIEGIFSDADFNLSRQLIEARTIDGESVLRPKQFTNNTVTNLPVEIKDKGGVNKFMPQIIAQFTKDTIPEVTVTPQSKAKAALIVKRDLIDMWKTSEEFQVLDIVDNSVVEQFSPCIFTNLSFKEDETTGEGIFPSMTIEQVTFTNLQEITVQIKTSNKGRQAGKVTTPSPDTAPKDPTAGPVDNTKAAAADVRTSSDTRDSKLLEARASARR